MNAANIKQVAAAALSSIERILSPWLPEGKRQGHEYVVINPTRTDSNLGSFPINCNTGAWADLPAMARAAIWLRWWPTLRDRSKPGRQSGLPNSWGYRWKNRTRKTRYKRPKVGRQCQCISPQASKPAWRALLPVPDGAPQPYAAYTKHGKPSMNWEYHNAVGQLLCLVYRFEPKEEGERKQFFPLTYCEDETGKRAWRWQGLPDLRPLYHLDKLTANASAPDNVEVRVCTLVQTQRNELGRPGWAF